MNAASSSLAAGTRLHVERTGNPAVLRWVVHHADLADAGDGTCRPDARSALGGLVASGDVADVCVRDGHVLVRTTDPSRWPALAPRVQHAVAADLAAGADWLVHRHADGPSWSLRLGDDRSPSAAPPETLSCCPHAGAACGHCSHR